MHCKIYKPLKSLKTIILLLALITTSHKVAVADFHDVDKIPDPPEGCGVWNSNTAGSERCSIFGTSNVIPGGQRCSQIQSHCCPSLDMCIETNEPSPVTDPDNPPVNNYEISDENCGSLFTDPSIGSNICIEVGTRPTETGASQIKVIPNATTCPLSQECCKNLSFCTIKYGFVDRQCVQSATGIYDSLERCELMNQPENVIQYEICQQAGPLEDECVDCMGTKKNPKNYMWTAVGCIPTNIVSNDENGGMINAIFRIGLGVAGGFALIFILFGAFTITTSAGNPEKVQNGKEIVTAAIIGLVFIILSSVILRFIGVSILQIPGF